MIEPLGLAAGVLITMLALSVASFLALAWDKRAAARAGWRTREATLHLLELLGGWPGSLLGSALLRHKSRKLGYRLVRFGCIVLHLAALVGAWWLWGLAR